MEPGASLVLGDGSEVDDGTTLAVYEGATLVLGPRSFVGHHCTLASRRSVVLGEGAFLAEMVSVRDHDHAVGHQPSSGQVVVEAVEIGAHAWVGAKVTVLKGAVIGAGAVVGANAVVRGTIPAATVAVGIPAKVVGPTDRERA
jgi:acetyltransferase-like isoleucine patch superfamily enzyme